jgi:ribosomal protein S18 acetylase RimI-like enzyme
MSEIVVRELAKNDLDAVSDVHIRAFEGRALAALGHEAVRRYYHSQLTGPHDAIYLGAFQADNLLGFCFAGVFRGSLSLFLRNHKWFLAWRVFTHPWLIFSSFFRERIILALRVLKFVRAKAAASQQLAPSRVKSFGILAIAVDPGCQGAGVGKQLMQISEQIARQRGFTQMHLTVDVKNVGAIRFYEGLAWQKVVASDGIWHGSMSKKMAGE